MTVEHSNNPHDAMRLLADLLESCEPEDDQPVTWGALRRQVAKAARGGSDA